MKNQNCKSGTRACNTCKFIVGENGELCPVLVQRQKRAVEDITQCKPTALQNFLLAIIPCERYEYNEDPKSISSNTNKALEEYIELLNNIPQNNQFQTPQKLTPVVAFRFDNIVININSGIKKDGEE